MSLVIVTGSAGLVGAEAVRVLAAENLDVIGIDNDMRRVFFGDAASTAWSRHRLEQEVKRYRHVDGDVRDQSLVTALFAQYGTAITAVIHAAAQPSHDWAGRDPQTDFTINANGTLNLLEATRRHCPDKQQRVVVDALAGEIMLGQPDIAEPEPFGKAHLLDLLVDAIGVLFRRAMDSPLEGDGFEPLVPRTKARDFRRIPGIAGGSSTGESDVVGG